MKKDYGRVTIKCLIVICAIFTTLFMSSKVTVNANDSVDMYRLYNRNSGEHFYTSNIVEKNNLVSLGWKYEGVGWIAPISGDPVYRLYNANGGEHHYTLSSKERDVLIKIGWKYEGIGWYSAKKDDAESLPLYREYNPNAFSNNHNYTTSKSEHSWLIGLGWKDEGIGWYGIGEGQKSTIARPSQNGALSVKGTQLVDESGREVQLRGVSTHGLAWFPDYVNKNCFSNLKSWGANVVRLALYTHEYNGYCNGGNQSELKALVESGIEYATENDMYVIVDWHVLNEGNPNVYKEQSKQFFQEISQKYADSNNVIYEICNEPCNGTTWSDIKSYANEIIPIIKGNDEDALVLVGTPNWSQYVDEASTDPIQGYSNIMYTLHFYAATHKEDLQNKLKTAINNGLPIFVSEFGICDASGNGTIDESSANTWISLLDSFNISYVCWNLSNKNEASALLNSSCTKTFGFTESDLSQEGKWLYNVLQNHLK